MDGGNTMAAGTATQRVPCVEVVVTGELDAWSAPRINDVLEQAMSLSPQQVIIDLAGCPSIDAAGIILLLDAHRRAMRSGGTVALRSPSARLCRNLRLAHVDRVLHVIDPEAAAPGGAPSAGGTGARA